MAENISDFTFEEILPWDTTGGDTGLSSRLKLKRNFDKVKAMYDRASGQYLSKVHDDTANGFIKLIKGLQVGERFVSGLLGEGGVFRKEADGATYIECDKLYVRMKAYFDSVEIKEWNHSKGNRVASKANMKCVKVDWYDSNGNVLEQTSSNLSSAVMFRCFFRGNDGDTEVTNDFVVGDQAYCHITNVVSTSEMYNHHFWRLVIGKSTTPDVNGDHWIDLSNATSNTINGVAYAGYQAGSDVPTEQDDIIQLGNVNDPTRRGAIIEFVGGENAPAYQIFQGIGDIGTASTIAQKRAAQYTYSGKNYIDLGYNSQTGRAYMNVAGDFRFGSQTDSGSYIKYNQETGQVEVKARVTFLSPSHGGGTQETTFEQFASAVAGDISNLQSQIDGQIETWFYDYMPVAESSGAPASTVPLTDKEPYKTWYEDDHGGTASEVSAERIKHLGDLFYDNTSGYAFRFSNTGTEQPPVFVWVVIQDSAVIKALRDAADAYDLADNKRRVFVAKPTPPYEEGDLWVNATGTFEFITDGQPKSITYDNDLLRCKKAKPVRDGSGTVSDGNFSIIDWELASKYTDDKKIDDFLDGYSGTLTQVRQQIDKKAETWYLNRNPESNWYDPQATPPLDKRSEHVGDLWYCTVDIANTNYKKDTTWYYKVTGGSGTQADPYTYGWVQQNVPQSVFDTIDTKKAIYTTWGAWVVDGTSILEDGDLYIPSEDHVEGSGASAVTYKANNVYKWNETANEWQKTEDQKLLDFLNGYGGTLQNYVKTQVDKKAETWVSSSNPATAWYDSTQTPVYDVRDEHVGDMWLNSGKTTIANVDSMKTAIYTKNGSTYSWVVDDSIPNSVFDTIDGKKSIYVGWNDWVVNNVNRLQVRDLFIPSSDTTQGDVTYYANKVYKCTNASTPTFQEIDYTDNTVVNEIITKYGQILGITATAENVGEAAGYLSAILNHPAGTTVAGGLVLTSLIAMRGTESTPLIWGGMNGAYLSDETGTSPYRYKGHGVAAWYGGAMVDYESLTPAQKAAGWGTGANQTRFARSLFRFDGSGYVASGNISWSADGTPTIKGDVIETATLKIGDTTVNLSDYVTLGTTQTITAIKAFTGGLVANRIYLYKPNLGNDYGAVYLEYSSAKQGVCLVGGGLFTDSYLSAHGAGSGGGSGSVSLNQPLSGINSAGLAATAAGQALVYNGSEWKYSNAPGTKLSVGGNLSVGGTVTGTMFSGAGFKISGLSNGDNYVLLAGGGKVALSDIGGGSYLPLSGGTMTGSITMGTSHYIYGVNETYGSMLHFDGNRTVIGSVGATSTLATHLRSKTGHLTCGTSTTASYTIWDSGNFTPSNYLPLSGGTMTGGITMDAASNTVFNDKGILFGTSGTYGRLSAKTNGNVALCAGDGGAVYITPNSSSTIATSGRLVVGASTFTYGGNTIWHAGNDGADSGLDADLLDGLHASDMCRKFSKTVSANAGVRITFTDECSAIIFGRGTSAIATRIVIIGNAYNTYSQWTCLERGSNVTWCKVADSRDIELMNNSSGSLYVSVLMGRGTVTFTDITALSGTAVTDKMAMLSSDITGNAATATALQTSRTIWGQTFDGTADVSGSITGATSITATGLTTTKTLSISSTSAVAHLIFSRGGNNYITAPSGGNISFVCGGKSVSNASRDMYISDGAVNITGTLNVSSNSTIGGTLGVTGVTTLGGALDVTGAATLSSTLAVTGDTTLGSTLYVNGTTVSQTIRAKTDKTYNLGSSSYYWKYLYVTRIYLASGVYLEYNSNKAGVHLVGAGLYSDSFLSAHGAGSGGGSGSVPLNQPLSGINSAGLAAPNSNLPYQAIVWTGSKWDYSINTTIFAKSIIANTDITVDNGNLKVNYGRAAVGGAINSDYKLTVYGAGLFGNLAIGHTTNLSSVQLSCVTVEAKNSPLYLKTAIGYVYASAAYSNQSDIRLKDIVGDVNATVEDIAATHVFNFRWKRGDDTVMLGTSAQDWQRVLPYAVSVGPEGYLTLDYAGAALAATVITARKVVDHERRIAKLEAENKRLRKEIRELKSA